MAYRSHWTCAEFIALRLLDFWKWHMGWIGHSSMRNSARLRDAEDISRMEHLECWARMRLRQAENYGSFARLSRQAREPFPGGFSD
jgi:hypothetical protein